MAQLIDGKRVAAEILDQVAADTAALAAEGGPQPGLAVVLVGEDPASQVYVRSKRKACRRTGVASIAHDLPATTSEAELLALIDRLNADPTVHGILVQLPCPPIDSEAVIARIAPTKDVDGFHPYNVGLLTLGRPGFVPCTPAGIVRLLDRHGVECEGRRAVVVGRSAIVGKPVAALLLQRNATVTVCHSRTRDLPARVAEADIVVAAIGRPGFVRGDWIRPGAVVVDVGINRVDDGQGGSRLVGDVAFEAAARAALITPVPGGVGPMTIALLLENTVAAARAAQRG